MNTTPIGLSLIETVLSALISASVVVGAVALFARRNVDAYVVEALRRQPQVTKSLVEELFRDELAERREMLQTVTRLAAELGGVARQLQEQGAVLRSNAEQFYTIPLAVRELTGTLDKLDRTLGVLSTAQQDVDVRVARIEGHIDITTGSRRRG